ncbi:MAG: hypothetical protein NT120_02045 [Candidatus Aenigmarchaeota archaeon]|nr:hypothetical protein [Candidatus Aenigmarchaeota archaeon]
MKLKVSTNEKFIILAFFVIIAFIISFFTLYFMFYQSVMGMYGMMFSNYQIIILVTAFVPAIVVGLAVAIMLEEKSKVKRKRRKR